MKSRLLGLMLLAVVCLGSGGCEKLFQKDTKTIVAGAEKKISAGDFRGAVLLYESALDGTPKTAELHYRMAVIYDAKLQSPLDALHHFARYLELAPSGSFAREAKTYKSEGELKLVTSLNTGPLMAQGEALRLRGEIAKLNKTITELRAPKNMMTLPGGAKGEMVRKPIPEGGRIHVVASRETLASIAIKYYKNKANWKIIQDANFYTQKGQTATIKPGDQLYVPVR